MGTFLRYRGSHHLVGSVIAKTMRFSSKLINCMNVVRNPHNNRSQLLSSYTSKWQIHNITVDHLYSDCLDARCFGTWRCGSTERDCPVTNLIGVNQSNVADWPEPARAVIEGAGVRTNWANVVAN